MYNEKPKNKNPKYCPKCLKNLDHVEIIDRLIICCFSEQLSVI